MKQVKRTIRWIFSIFAFTFLCSSVHVQASDDDCPPAYYEDEKVFEGNLVKQYKGYEYMYSEEYQGIVIVDYNGKEKVVKIPATIDGVSVVELANYAFAENRYVEKFIVPTSVVRIGDHCFAYCKNLKKINIPEGVIRLEGTFSGCIKLKEITLPQSLVFLESSTFFKCKNLKKIEIPDMVQLIDVECFLGCEKLQKVKLPANLIKIEERAFLNCSSLKTLTIPEKTIFIKDSAFEGCTSLKKAVLPPNLIRIEEKVFKNCKSLKEITIPKITHVIEVQAFNGCKNLKKIKFQGTQISRIREKAFKGIHRNAIFDAPNKVVKKYRKLLDKSTGFVKSMKIK